MKDYTVSEVAKKLQVSSRTIQREITRGNIVSHKVGRKFFIAESSLERYLQRDTFEIETSVAKFCQERKYDMVNLLQHIVSLSSNSEEPEAHENLARYLKKTLEGLGFRTVMYGSGDSAVVHATYGFAKNGILLNCPIDTVAVGDNSGGDASGVQRT